MERAPFRRPITPAAMAAQTTEFEQTVAEDESTLGPAQSGAPLTSPPRQPRRRPRCVTHRNPGVSLS
jgi:hypothetical protein